MSGLYTSMNQSPWRPPTAASYNHFVNVAGGPGSYAGGAVSTYERRAATGMLNSSSALPDSVKQSLGLGSGKYSNSKFMSQKFSNFGDINLKPSYLSNRSLIGGCK